MMYSYFRILVISFFIGLNLVACGGGGSPAKPGGGSLTDGPFSISPASLTFSAQIDAFKPDAQIITLSAQEPQSEIPKLVVNGDPIDVISQRIVNDTTIEVTVNVVSPALLGIGTHTASVDISGPQYSASVPVTYIVTEKPPGNPNVNYISPNTIAPGTVTDVIIRGSGFSRFDSSNLPSVTIGSLQATNVAIVNDSEIRASSPSLTAGSHAVDVQGSVVSFTSTASLHVVADQVFSTTSFTTSGEKTALIFDKQRKAVYVVNTTSDTLERYQYQSGTSWNMDSLSLSGLTDAALSADGKTLVLIDGINFYEVDPAAATMTAGTGVAAPMDFMQSLDRIATANNGVMVAVNNNQWSSLYTYDLLTGATGKHTYLNSSDIEVSTSIYSPWIFDTHDGSKIYFGEHGSSASRLYQLDTSDNTFADTGLSAVSFEGYFDMAITPDNSVILLNGKDIYNADLSSLLGSLPQSHDSAALSPDGATAYVYLDFANILRAYDISNPALPVQIGSDVTLTNAAGMRTQMRISDDGNTLFLVGLDNLHIIDLTTFSF